MSLTCGYVVAAFVAAWGALMLLKVKIPYLLDPTTGNAIALIVLAIALCILIAAIKKNAAST